jgi:hypothetical protein
MEWFKHYSNAGRNGTIIKLKRKYGFAGIGKYWTILELIAQEMRPGDDRCSLRLPVNDWAILLGFKPNNLKKFVTYLTDICNISARYLEDDLTLECPKLLKLRDSRNGSRATRGSIDKSKSKKKSKSKSDLPAAPASPEGKPKAKKIRVPQAYLDARDTGTWPIDDKDGLIKAAAKYDYQGPSAWAMFVDFVNKKEASGYVAIDWVAAFRNQCDGVRNKGWDGPKGRQSATAYTDPGLEQAEAARREMEDNERRRQEMIRRGQW